MARERTTSAAAQFLTRPKFRRPPVRKGKISLKQLRLTARGVINTKTADGKSKADRADWMDETREKFETWTEADEDQRDRELDDLAMYAGEQWPDDVKLARAGQDASNGLPPVPARPCLVINKFREPVNQVLNGLRDADLGIEITAADDFEELGVTLDATEIKTREGLIRRIQRESQAGIWRLAAARRALIAGRGYYGVMTRFCTGPIDGAPSLSFWDQELYVTGWWNQACVTLDPTHESQDGSDATGGFIGRWITWEAYKAKYPKQAKQKNLISQMHEQEFVALGDDAPTWFRSSGDLRAVHLVDYFYTVETTRTILLLADGSAAWEDEAAHDEEAILDRREVTEQTIKWCVLDGLNPEPLEEREWPGPDIPIIKVVGEELDPYDDQRRVEGLVRPGRDSQQGFNAMASKSVELVGLTPIPSIFIANGQDEGYEKEWNLMTTRTLGRVHYNFKDAEGQPVGPPTTIDRSAPIQAVAVSLQMFDEAVQTTTRRHDPSLGKVDPALKSGRAITQVIDQSKEGTSNFQDNLRISIRREAVILNNLLYPVYGTRPGRLAKIVDAGGKPQTIAVNAPAMPSATGGAPSPMMIPHPTDPTQPPQIAPMDHPSVPPTAQKFQLTPHANATINIKIEKNFDTQRQETNELLVQMVEADPSQMLVVGDLLWQTADLAMHEELAKRYRAMLAPPIQALIASESGGPQIPPQVQQQLDAAKQMGDQAQQEIQALQQQIAAKTTEQQGKLAIVQLQEQAESQRAAADREVKLAVATLNAKVETLSNEMAVFLEERKRLGAHVADASQTLQEHAHDSAERGKDRLHDIVHAQLDHGHTLEQQAQAAALAPPPVDPNADSGAAETGGS